MRFAQFLQILAVKLERLLRNWGKWGGSQVRELVAQRRVRVNGEVAENPSVLVGPFDEVECDGGMVQERKARSLMMHKPLGVVSATRDEEHRTVVDLVKEEWAEELHLAGRLDRFTSGLVVLTNDSCLSEKLTRPESLLGKRYRVACDQPILTEAVSAFEEGLWFEKEQVQTRPAKVKLISDRECLLTIFEGKHHQVKRMFARFGIKVTALHREAMGPLELDARLEPGQWRDLTAEEYILLEGG